VREGREDFWSVIDNNITHRYICSTIEMNVNITQSKISNYGN